MSSSEDDLLKVPIHRSSPPPPPPPWIYCCVIRGIWELVGVRFGCGGRSEMMYWPQVQFWTQSRRSKSFLQFLFCQFYNPFGCPLYFLCIAKSGRPFRLLRYLPCDSLVFFRFRSSTAAVSLVPHSVGLSCSLVSTL